MASPAISIVMSVYNGERFLRESVESVLRQTFGDFEFVIIDDGSTDATASILEEYQKSDPRVRVTRQQHAGVAAALAAGCARSRGQLLARTDADDIALPTRLGLQVAFLETHPEVGVLGTGIDVIDEQGKVLRTTDPPRDHASAAWRLLFRPPVGHPTVMMRRALLEEYGGYDAGFEHAEDYELWTRLAEVTRFANLPVTLMRYRIHQDMVTRREQHAMREATVRVRRRFAARLLGREVSREQCDWLERFERGSRRLDEAQIRSAVELLFELYEAMLERGIFRREEAAGVRADLARRAAEGKRRAAPRGRRLARWLRRWATDPFGVASADLPSRKTAEIRMPEPARDGPGEPTHHPAGPRELAPAAGEVARVTRRPIEGRRSAIAGFPHVVISLTSIPVRSLQLHETIDSLLGQDYPHLSVELYLSRDTLPRELSVLQRALKARIVEMGASDAPASSPASQASRLAIVLVEDIGPATKFIYAPRRHPESLIAICDDDQVYHPSWLATLVEWNRATDNSACVGFSGPVTEESFQGNPALRALENLPYPDRDGRIVARRIITDQRLHGDPVPILWPQSHTGYLLPSGRENESSLAEHYSRCMSAIPRANLEEMKLHSGTMTSIPDDPVIGSYHQLLGLDVLAVPRGFSQRELDTASVGALDSRQHEYELRHGESMSTTVYRSLRESGLL